jgi:hypothetical protein
MQIDLFRLAGFNDKNTWKQTNVKTGGFLAIL